MGHKDVFTKVEKTKAIKKSQHEALAPVLQLSLLEAQRALAQRDYPVIILLGGVDGAGKGETGNLLQEWMDGRFIKRVVYEARTTEERERPKRWRDWMNLPPKGRFGVYFGSWYTEPLIDRVYGRITDEGLEAELADLCRFEKTLAADGALIIKLWFHLSKDQQRERLENLEKDGQTRWRVTRIDWRHFKLYDRFRRICAKAVEESHSPETPWTIVSGVDARTREVTVARHILERLASHDLVVENRKKAKSKDKDKDSKKKFKGALAKVDLEQKLSDEESRETLRVLQDRLHELSYDAHMQGRSMVLAFEGWDAAGKGGAIRRLMRGMDARIFQVVPVAAPSQEERAYHYLWRFWRGLPRDGRMVIFDRSWYGRVLVERIEGFARRDEWQRAYDEIVAFESQLADHGWLVRKFWIHISSEEQLARFEARAADPTKQHKITEEDWRNREKWPDYEAAVEEMVERTDHKRGRWELIPGNCKRTARVEVLRRVCDSLEEHLFG